MIIKYAQIAGVWPKIYNKLKNPPPGINLGSFPSKLPPMNKIKIEQSSSGNAVGYVTTEDADNNGIIDTIHIVSPKLEQAFNSAGITPQDLQNIDKLDLNKLMAILYPFVDLISHEVGHIQDYEHNSETPFPGGEGAAERESMLSLQQVKVNAANNTNNNYNFIEVGYLNMDSKILEVLAKLADRLDREGAVKIADKVDEVIQKYSQDWLGRKTNFGDMAGEDLGGETLKGEIEESVQRIRESQMGNIRPKGDPYTYQLNSDKTFTIMTTPRGKEQLSGRVISEGAPGYELLREEAARMGLMKSRKQLELEREQLAEKQRVEQEKERARLARESRIKRVADELGLQTVPKTSEEITHMVNAKRSIFRSKLAQVKEYVNDALGGKGSIASMANLALKEFTSPDIDGDKALDVWSNFLVLELGLDRRQLGLFDMHFNNAMKMWKDSVKLEALNKDVFGAVMASANDDAGVVKVASNQSKAPNKYDKLFWFDGQNPFNRSDAKFKE